MVSLAFVIIQMNLFIPGMKDAGYKKDPLIELRQQIL